MGAEYQIKCVMNFFAKINNNNKMFFQFEVNGRLKNRDRYIMTKISGSYN